MVAVVAAVHGWGSLDPAPCQLWVVASVVQFGGWLQCADRAEPAGRGSLDPAQCLSLAVVLVASPVPWLHYGCWARCRLRRVLAAYRRPGWGVPVGCCRVLVALVVAAWHCLSAGHLLLGYPQGSQGSVGNWGVGVWAWLCVFVLCLALGRGGHLVRVPVCHLGGHFVRCRCRGGA